MCQAKLYKLCTFSVSVTKMLIQPYVYIDIYLNRTMTSLMIRSRSPKLLLLPKIRGQIIRRRRSVMVSYGVVGFRLTLRFELKCLMYGENHSNIFPKFREIVVLTRH